MVPTQFIGQNAHFAVSLLAALASFAVFWLIFDAWIELRHRREIVKWAGFLILAIAFLMNAATLDQRSLIPGLLASQLAGVGEVVRILAYALIVIGQLIDPLTKRPTYAPEPAAPAPAAPAAAIVTVKAAADKKPSKAKKSHGWTGYVPLAGLVTLPIMAFAVSILYWRRATVGLERHLRPVAQAFAFFGLYELFTVGSYWQDTSNPLLYRFVAAYGPVWWLAQVSLLGAGIILGRWVWTYLTKRLLTQLFMVFVTATVVIFFVSTVGFSFLLLRNVQSEALTELSTASRVLNYAVASRQAQTSALAEAASANPVVVAAVAAHDHKTLEVLLSDYLPQHNLSSLIILGESGQVLLRAENPDRWGDSLSSDSLVDLALVGKTSTSVETQTGVVSPTVSLVSSRPIRDSSGAIVGAIIAGQAVSNAFVDGIKHDTGLDSTVYAGDTRAATTLVAADGTTRSLGVKETDAKVKDNVLQHGKDYSGTISIQHRDYLASYTPLKDADNNVVGMLTVSRPQDQLLGVAGQSVQLTFLLAICLLILTIAPIYWIAKRISDQVK